MRHNAPFLLLLLSTSVSLLSCCSLSGCPQGSGERRPTISLTMLYTSACEQWRPATKNSGNRGTAIFSSGWLLHARPIDIYRPAETDRCQRNEELGGGGGGGGGRVKTGNSGTMFSGCCSLTVHFCRFSFKNLL